MKSYWVLDLDTKFQKKDTLNYDYKNVLLTFLFDDHHYIFSMIHSGFNTFR